MTAGCSGCHRKWDSEAVDAHRAHCPRFDAYCAALTARPLIVNTAAGAVKITADSTMSPDGIRLIGGGTAPVPPAPKLEGLEAWLPTSKPLYTFKVKAAMLWDAPAVQRYLDELDHMIRGLYESCGISMAKPAAPLDVEYDGIALRVLLERDRQRRTEDPDSAWRSHVRPSPAQRAAVSAHWSAELRAKVKASTEAERNRVVVDLEEP